MQSTLWQGQTSLGSTISTPVGSRAVFQESFLNFLVSYPAICSHVFYLHMCAWELWFAWLSSLGHLGQPSYVGLAINCKKWTLKWKCGKKKSKNFYRCHSLCNIPKKAQKSFKRVPHYQPLSLDEKYMDHANFLLYNILH